MKMDMIEKRGAFIGKANSLLQEFGNVSPEVLTKIVQSFAMNIYGSNLWDIFGKDCERLYASFNVAIRNVFKVDRCTHRYMIEPLSEMPHLKTMLASKFISFHDSLVNSKKFSVRFLARISESDLRTVSELCGIKIEKLTPKIVKANLRYKNVEADDKWRIDMTKELLDLRDKDELYLP